MSNDKAIVTDEHKFPFSLVSEFKHGHNRKITRVGDVSELMDKAIGRLVFRVKGSVSANNYIEFDCLSLTGPILHIQMCLARPNVATVHLEVLTTTNIPLRLTLSTLYNGDQPRFLGRSLRLPLPTVPGWMILSVNLNDVLANYCVSQGAAIGRDAPLQLHTIKKIQLCSNMLVRDIVTADKELSPDPKYLPKELAVKPLPPSHALQFENLVDYCRRLPPSTASPQALGALKFSPGTNNSNRKKPTAIMASASRNSLTATQAGKAVVEENIGRSARPNKADTLPPPPAVVSTNTTHSDSSVLPPSPATPAVYSQPFVGGATSPTVFRMNIGETPDSIAAAARVISASSANNEASAPLVAASKRTGGIRLNPSTSAQPPVVQHSAEDAEALAAMFDSEASQQSPVQSGNSQLLPPGADDNYAIKRTPSFPGSNTHVKFGGAAKSTVTAKLRPTNGSSNAGGVATTGTVLSKALTTPRHIPLVQIPGTAQSSSSSSGGTPGGVYSSTPSSTFSTVKYNVPDTAPADRLLQLERLLGYSGGPAILLYEGRMLLLATGSLLVMVDLDTEGRPQPKNGLFRAFRSASSLGSSVAMMERELGFKQAFLRGHTNPVGLIEVSEKEALMVTGETTTPNGQLILWDLREGKRLATLRPHLELLQCAGFSTDCAMLVTVGTDVQCRQQIVVWDVAQLISDKTVNITSKSSALIAKQISEFPLQKIRFSPFEEFGLVSCGRENIRFWRIRKGHLPGRPVLLNEYARGFIFQDIGFHSDAGVTPRDPRRPAVYVASNRGLLLRISCQTDQIICAYQLHTCAIRTLSMHSGYAVTGAEDNKLRLWPLDFSDFLLEAQHEGVVTNIRIALDGRKLAIGTAAGTLGVLNVSEHSYNTVLRSHSASVNQVVPCTFGEHKGTEFATVGKDNTVRIWNAISGNQVIEFTSEKDQPTCCVYHPASSTYIACGYSSGFLRIFDVTTATAILETRAHLAAIVSARYLLPARSVESDETSIPFPAVLLATASLDGTVLIHDASSEGNYLPVKKISFGMPLEKVLLEVSDDYAYLAVASTQVGSLTVFETRDFTAQLRLAGSGTSAGHERSSSPMPGSGSASGANFPTAVMQSITYMADNPVHPGLPDSVVSATPTAGVELTTTIPPTPAPTVPAVKPTFNSTFSAAVVSSGRNNASTSGLHAPLVGLCFGSDRNGAVVLLATEKHLVSVSVCAGSGAAVGSSPAPFRTSTPGAKRTATAWDERQSKRLECGAPTFMTKDPITGLLLLALRTPLQDSSSVVRSIPGSSVASDIANAAKTSSQLGGRRAATAAGSSGVLNNKLSDVANAFAVLDWKFRPANQTCGEKLSLSVPQVYQDLSDEIQGICSCMIGNKVVTVDAGGSIAVWHLRSSNLPKVKVNLSAPSPSDALGPAIAREYRNTESGLSRNETAQDTQDVRSNLVDAINEAGGTRELNSATITSSLVPATPSTQALTRDFERAVLHDPSIWSANSAASSEVVAEQKAQSESLAEQVRSSLYEDNITSPVPMKTAAAEHSAKNRTRMSSKISAKSKHTHTPQTVYGVDDLNTSTASYEIMFQEEDPALQHPTADLSLSMASERSIRASSELNNSRTDSVCRSTSGGVTSLPVPDPVIDDPLAGLSMWKELQSPASANKSRSPMHTEVAGAVAMSQLYDSADDDESTNAEENRLQDSLELLQRARSNMQASRLGAVETDTPEDASRLQQHQEFFTAGGNGEQVHVAAISHSNAVPPQFCQEKSMMVTCDGSGIYVKYVNSGSQVLLGFPEDLVRQRDRTSITELRLHESGSMVAALVRHSPKNAIHLVVWVMVGFDELEEIDFDPTNVEWRCVGAAALGAAKTAHHDDGKGCVCLAWSSTGALLLLQTQDKGASTVPHLSTNGLIKLSFIPADVIYAGAIGSKWDELSQVIQNPLGRIAYVKSIPGVVVDEPDKDIHAQVPTVHAVIVGERRVMMVAFTAPIKTRRGHVHTDKGLVQVVWSDDLGARGPVLGLEAVRCSTFHMASTIGAVRPLAPTEDDPCVRCRQGSDCLVAILDSCGSIKFSVFSFYSQPSLRDPTGKINRLSTPCVRSVTNKIPAANASGALRTMSVFAPRSRRSPHFLALAAAHDVRLFTLNLRELNAKAISVNLTSLYKVALDCAPDYLLCLRPLAYGAMASKKLIAQMGPAGHAPHLLVANHQGYMGFVPNARWVQGRHLPSTCLALQSPPLHCPAGAVVKSLLVSCSASHTENDQLLLTLCKGQLHMLHSTSGIKLHFGGCGGITYATCMEALPSMRHSASIVAVGSRCGRIALFDTASMQQQELIALSSDAAPLPSIPVETSSNSAEPAQKVRSSSGHGSALSGHNVTSLRSLGCDGFLLAATEVGKVYVVCLGGTSGNGKANPLACIFSPSTVRSLPPPLYLTAEPDNVQVSAERMHNPFQLSTVLATVIGETRLTGVVRRHSNVLELYFLHPKKGLVNFFNVSVKTPQDLLGNAESAQSAYFSANSPVLHDTSSNIAITACHVLAFDRSYVISIVGRVVPSGTHFNPEEVEASPVFLFSGTVTLPAPSVSMAQTIVDRLQRAEPIDATPYLATLKQRVMLDEAPTVSSTVATSYLSSFSATAAAANQVALAHAALTVHNSVSFAGTHCAVVTADYIYVVDLLKSNASAPGSDVRALCTAIVPCAAFNTSWTDATALLVVESVLPVDEVEVGETPVEVGARSCCATSLNLTVYRKNKIAMLKFRINCM